MSTWDTWQSVATDEDGVELDRIAVPGGWLYRLARADLEVMCMTFVPKALEPAEADK